MLKQKRLRIAVILGLCGILAASIVLSAAASPPSDPVPPPHLPPLGDDPAPPPELTQEERDAIDGAWDKAQRERTPRVEINDRFTVRVVSGPATRGMTFDIAGKTLTLPKDAELGGLLVSSDPSYIIKRKGRSASLSNVTGEFRIRAADRPVFKFLFDTFGEDKFREREERIADRQERREERREGRK